MMEAVARREPHMTTIDLAAVPGVAECALDAETLGRLPEEAPPAPWDCTLAGVVWWCRGGRAAAEAAGPLAGRTRAPLVVGGLIDYAHTPVGRYNEVLGAVVVPAGPRPRVTIPFMAVDAPDSLVAGRANWSLPKCLAGFGGSPADGTMTATGRGWSVRASARPFGPAVPLPVTGRMVQPWPDGRRREAVVVGRARVRWATVTVTVESEGRLAGWLRPGQHLGAVLSHARFHLAEPS
jgi:hypothetical protein